MGDEAKTKRGEAAWKDAREEISRRNAETRKQGRAQRESHQNLSAARERADVQREAEQLRKLNSQIASRHGGPR